MEVKVVTAAQHTPAVRRIVAKRQRASVTLTAMVVAVLVVTLVARMPSGRAPAISQAEIRGASEQQAPRYAVTSSLWSDHVSFTRYALALGHSLVHTNEAFLQSADVDMVILTYPDISFSPASLRALQAVGWQLRQVPRIAPPPSTIEMYKENFGRINLWSWTEYTRIVYIDADCVVLRDISSLFLLPTGVTGAVGDAWPDMLDNSRFNAGILSLEPAMGDFVEMIASYRNHTNYQYEGHAEQGLLNWYFKHRVTRLPRIYNFNMVLCTGHKALWDSMKRDARIMHYTIFKPGGTREGDMAAVIDHPDSRVNKDLQEPLTWWWDTYEAMSRETGWNGTL